MTQKTPVDQLQIGMYVAALDRAWSDVPFKPPFELQAFTIASDADIAEVQKYCEYVLVDMSLSRHAGAKTAVPQTLTVESGSESIPNATAGAAPPDTEDADRRARILYREQRYEGDGGADNPVHGNVSTGVVLDESDEDANVATTDGDVVYPDLVPVEVELENAREVIGDTEAVFQKVADNIKGGEQIDTAAVKKNVETLVQSVVRNPDALSWLTRLKQQDGYTYSHAMAVCVLALTIGRHLGLPVNAMHDLGIGALTNPSDLQSVGMSIYRSIFWRRHQSSRRTL